MTDQVYGPLDFWPLAEWLSCQMPDAPISVLMEMSNVLIEAEITQGEIWGGPWPKGPLPWPSLVRALCGGSVHSPRDRLRLLRIAIANSEVRGLRNDRGFNDGTSGSYAPLSGHLFLRGVD